MPAESQPATPLAAYRAIIDELVNQTSHGVAERLVRQSGVFAKAPGQNATNPLVSSLTADQRKLLADMLREERTAAIHDVLAVLQWWLSCGGVGLTFRGEPMPFDLSGAGLHGDYVGRRDGWPWPGDDADAPAPQGAPKSSRELARAAAADAKITDRKCPHCGQPCPSYRKTCKHCRRPVSVGPPVEGA